MSFQAMAWAVGQQLPTREKFVLLMLANYASNDKWECHPSVNTLAENTGMSRDTVMRAIKELEGNGYLEILRRTVDGINLPNIYQLQKSAGGSSAVQGVVAHSDYRSSTQLPGVVAQSDSNLSLKPINEPVSGKRTRGARLPEDWTLPNEYLDWVLNTFPSASVQQVQTIADKFKDYWIARAGAAALKADWFATWRNWIRTDFEKNKTKTKGPDFDDTSWADDLGAL